ncbi:unnamed protein product [Linum trigynum]|uniref:HMA domain-containing protein n=1 Tax=Linum trigynum TaxID=586398 RepID=A0AAV2FFW3_9ROSI
MEKNTSSVQEEAPTHGLHCKTWVLRVSIHCQGCKRKVSKILLAIHGVYTVAVDMKKQRVTVTGNVEAETLIRKRSNKGKMASICNNEPKNRKSNHEGNQEEENNSQKKKNKKKQKQSENRGAHEEEASKAMATIPDENSLSQKQTVVKYTPGNLSSGEKKRREGQNKAEKEGDQVNVDPNSASSSSVPPFSSGYNRYQQMTTNQVIPSPYPYPPQQYFYFPAAVNAAPNPFYLYAQQQANPFGYQSQLPPPPPSMGMDSSLQIFSDENVNGCSVM